MSIRKKIWTSLIIMLIIPAALILLLSALLLAVFMLLNPTVSFSLYDGFEISNPVIMQFIIFWGVMATAVVVTTSLCLSAYLNRHIIKPLHDINEAICHITSGDLTYEFAGSNDLELQKLCASIEELRLRLKDSVAKDIAREKEHKMLMANISHDIKTPVTSIKGHVEGILDGVASTPEQQAKYLHTILKKAEAIEEMAENLSLYSKLELGRILYHMEICDIAAFLHDTADSFVLDAREMGVDLQCTLPEIPQFVKFDRSKLRRVFANIINNAIKYRRQDTDSHLLITLRDSEHGVVLSFADNGIGIQQKDTEKVFEGFYRSDPSRNSQIKGNGLGLSISRQIIHDHGGKIWIRSTLYEGTEVTILLPHAQKPMEEDTNEGTYN